MNKANHKWTRTKPYPMTTCACCGKEIEKKSVNMRVCTHKCVPSDDFIQVCVRCGESKIYEEFRDYRGRIGEGAKLHTVCIECENAYSLARYHKAKGKTNG